MHPKKKSRFRPPPPKKKCCRMIKMIILAQKFKFTFCRLTFFCAVDLSHPTSKHLQGGQSFFFQIFSILHLPHPSPLAAIRLLFVFKKILANSADWKIYKIFIKHPVHTIIQIMYVLTFVSMSHIKPVIIKCNYYDDDDNTNI